MSDDTVSMISKFVENSFLIISVEITSKSRLKLKRKKKVELAINSVGSVKSVI